MQRKDVTKKKSLATWISETVITNNRNTFSTSSCSKVPLQYPLQFIIIYLTNWWMMSKRTAAKTQSGPVESQFTTETILNLSVGCSGSCWSWHANRSKRYRKGIFAFRIYIYTFQRKKSRTDWSSGKPLVVILLDLNAETVLACLTIAFRNYPTPFLCHRDEGSYKDFFWHLSSNSTYLTRNFLILPYKQINHFEEWKDVYNSFL